MVKDILIAELAKRDFNVLKVLLENVPFDDAYMKLGGFNLSAESYRKDDECVIDIYFDFNFACLNGTIYRTPDGLCELSNRYDIWVNEIETTPIANVDIDECGNVDVVKWYLENL